MAIIVNREPIPESLILDEVYRIGRDPQWQAIADEGDRTARIRQAAEYSAVNRMLLEQAAAEDPRPIDAALLDREVEHRRRPAVVSR